jgi:dynein heavy chain
MCTDAEIAEYQTQGLPADNVSAENAAIILNSARYPLMIDPQLQGIYWIKNREGKNMEVGRMGQKTLVNRIMRAIENGKPFLIENMGESIDPMLMPIIGRITVKRGTKRFIQIGDQEVQVDPNFRLYLHTKLSNPHYPPEVQAETTLVNFSVTQIGLEEQLLAMVVRNERSDLAEQRAALILQQNLFTIKVKQLEDGILRRLADAQGDITEDRALIEELELSKKISDDIAVKLEESRVTSEKINATSEKYRTVARRGALLFFIMSSLQKIHTYYLFSLTSFISFFLRGIHTDGDSGNSLLPIPGEDAGEEKKEIDFEVLAAQIARRVTEIDERDQLANDDTINQRLILLKQNITLVIYDFVRTGLFERDKLTVATLVTLRIMVDEGILPKIYMDVILRGRMAEECAPRGQELSKWLTENAWIKLKAIEEDLVTFDNAFENMSEKIATGTHCHSPTYSLT